MPCRKDRAKDWDEQAVAFSLKTGKYGNMGINRRDFLKQLAGIGGIALLGKDANVWAGEHTASLPNSFGVLVDTTLCVGCRSCEEACNQINHELPRKTPQSFKDNSVFGTRRRMAADSYTVVNRYNNPKGSKPVYVKFQCMHCTDPACVSACIVGALTKDSNGAVKYDPWKCIGCRYCMVACPFQVPAYEYDNAMTPQVRKCTFCFEKRISKGKAPACIQACPMEIMTFGNRNELIKIAKKRIEKYPDRYIHHVYGEHELGGTSWMYLSSLPFEKIDFPNVGYTSTPSYTEPIQHAIFKHFIPPLTLFTVLGGIMWFLRPGKIESESELNEEGQEK
ncbi:MAG: hydrogenase 2 operon protein HybA [Pseudomonadota bacterium]